MSGGISTIFEPSASRATEPLRAANAARPGSYGSVTTAPARSATRRTTVSCACDRSSKPCTCSGVPSQADTSRASRAAGLDAAARRVPRCPARRAAPTRPRTGAPGPRRPRRPPPRRRTRPGRRAPSRAGRTAGRARRGTARRRPRRRSCRARTPAISRASSSRRRAGRQRGTVGSGQPDRPLEHAVERHHQAAQQHAALAAARARPATAPAAFGTTSRASPPASRLAPMTAIQLRHLPRVRGTDDQVEWHPPRIRQSKSRSASSTRRRDSSSRVAGGRHRLGPRGRRRQTSTSPTATPMPATPTASGTSQANSPEPLGRRGSPGSARRTGRPARP